MRKCCWIRRLKTGCAEGKDGHKGVLVDAYGVYANPVSTELLAKLQVKHDQV